MKIDTPCGPGWHRYNHDGYGQKADGSPYDGTGTGRLWPLLTGERGHYEIAAGRTAYKYIKTMENFADACALIPEQVWDSEDLPSRRMFKGRPTGSAMPLVWAHAEYIQLLRSEHDKAVFDLLAPVCRRYSGNKAATDMQVWTFKQKLRELHPQQTLRVEVYAPSRLHWTSDNWTTIQDIPLSHAGLGVYAHEFMSGQFNNHATIKFTFYWVLERRWEGRDFSIAVREEPEAERELQHSGTKEIDRSEKKEFAPHLE